MQYLEELNEYQREAVEYLDGPALVIAGAGSGKTRVLTYKIVHLLNQGFRPYNILALTFTNKAAREMKERIASIVGSAVAANLWMGTFHSIFARILRKESQAIGFPSNYTIYDTIDSKSLLKQIIKDLKLDDKTYQINEVYGRISKAKNNLVTPQAYLQNNSYYQADAAIRRPEIGRIYQIYSQRCKSSGAMDFDDLLLQTNILFKNHPNILEKYQKKFAYILVDEYQDTNVSQYLIIKKLAEKHRRLFVVGDDSQSIYAFRGARIENILNFQNDYKENKLFKLEENYRSTQIIVDAANSLIEKNENRIPKEIFSKKDIGKKIKIFESMMDSEEGFKVANAILDTHLSDHFEYKDYAILYRTNAQSRIFEEALRKRNIPYKIYGGMSFYQRKEIKDLIAYFRLLVNPQDNEAFRRIINYPKRGIGNTTVDKLHAFSTKHNVPLWNIAVNLDKVKHNISTRTVNSINKFCAMILSFAERLYKVNAYEIAHDIASQTGILKELYNDKTPEGVSRYENIQELLNGIKELVDSKETEMVTLDRFLEEVSLMTNNDNEGDEDKNKISLMTIHSAKGLEFKNVFIVGLEEGLFPSSMSSMSQKELEEERRLFYVALTRAEQNLYISHSKMRYKWGNLTQSTPSRFIKEIDEKYLELNTAISINESQDSTKKTLTGISFPKKSQTNDISIRKKNQHLRSENTSFGKKMNFKAKSDSGYKGVVTDQSKISEGVMVEHEKFGRGKVIAIEGKSPNIKATIDFISVGRKNLLLKFAKLKIIN